jgi:asparagine synthase (glutamine-hydrolysing)
MCGIAGLWRFGAPADAARREAREADHAALGRMLAAIRHRGPDDEHAYLGERATAGVRRLSIIDVAGGRQPLANEDGTVWAGNNGELYNFAAVRARLVARGHGFATRTDTEIVPHLYEDHGVDFLRMIEGMFGLFVIDTRRSRLVLARDRSGVKPLYYAVEAGADGGGVRRLRFASELSALLADPRLPADVAEGPFGDYRALGWVPGEDTVLAGIRRLPAGHRLVAGEDDFRVEPYDPAGAWATAAPADPAAILDQLEGRLRGAVERQLVSDVPLGILLSGGIDSSLLVALLPESLRRESRTFCVGFAGGGAHDERFAARAVAAHLGTRHVERELDLDVDAWVARAGAALDEPLADPAAVPALAISETAGREVKVLLSGTGADELFGGYRRHRLGRVIERLGFLPRPLARAGAGLLAGRAGTRRSKAGEWLVWGGKALAARGAEDFLAASLAARAIAPDATWQALAGAPPGGPGPLARLVGRLRPGFAGGLAPERIALGFDRRFYLPDDLLLKEDRMTMAVSVEGRVPYLDEGVVPFADAIAPAVHLRGRGKWLLRALARRHLPAAIVERPKHGFSVPVTEWLRGPLAPRLHQRLAGGGASGRWDARALERLLGEHASGRRDHGMLLWTVLFWEEWWASPSGPGGRPRGGGTGAGAETRTPSRTGAP